jgi:hypothetical protein
MLPGARSGFHRTGDRHTGQPRLGDLPSPGPQIRSPEPVTGIPPARRDNLRARRPADRCARGRGMSAALGAQIRPIWMLPHSRARMAMTALTLAWRCALAGIGET